MGFIYNNGFLLNLKEENINNAQNMIPIPLETKRNKTENKNKKKERNIDVIDEDVEDNSIVCFFDGDERRPLAEGESITQQWSF